LRSKRGYSGVGSTVSHEGLMYNTNYMSTLNFFISDTRVWLVVTVLIVVIVYIFRDSLRAKLNNRENNSLELDQDILEKRYKRLYLKTLIVLILIYSFSFWYLMYWDFYDLPKVMMAQSVLVPLTLIYYFYMGWGLHKLSILKLLLILILSLIPFIYLLNIIIYPYSIF